MVWLPAFHTSLNHSSYRILTEEPRVGFFVWLFFTLAAFQQSRGWLHTPATGRKTSKEGLFMMFLCVWGQDPIGCYFTCFDFEIFTFLTEELWFLVVWHFVTCKFPFLFTILSWLKAVFLLQSTQKEIPQIPSSKAPAGVEGTDSRASSLLQTCGLQGLLSPTNMSTSLRPVPLAVQSSRGHYFYLLRFWLLTPYFLVWTISAALFKILLWLPVISWIIPELQCWYFKPLPTFASLFWTSSWSPSIQHTGCFPES